MSRLPDFVQCSFSISPVEPLFFVFIIPSVSFRLITPSHSPPLVQDLLIGNALSPHLRGTILCVFLMTLRRQSLRFALHRFFPPEVFFPLRLKPVIRLFVVGMRNSVGLDDYAVGTMLRISASFPFPSPNVPDRRL